MIINDLLRFIRGHTVHVMCLGVALLSALGVELPAQAQLVISGNENKIDLASGTPQVVLDAEPDSLTLLDFRRFPPRVRHLSGIANTVIGPPSNIAITPDGRLALIASSLKLDSQSETGYSPDNLIHVLDLTSDEPRIVGEVRVDRQPSGMSITPDGRLALVANRASGTVSVLAIDGTRVRLKQTVEICEPDEGVSDVAIAPDGRLAIVSVNQGGYLRLLDIDAEGTVTPRARPLSCYGAPYRCVITPDGRLGLTAGAGQGGAPDVDALTVIDLSADPAQTIDFVALGAGPESIEISPDGRLVAAVLMNGSNLPADDSRHTDHGLLVLLARRGRSFERVQQLPIGRIPEGVAFTADGRYLIVQCHPDRELWLFAVEDQQVQDTGERIKVPGMPSALRAGP